MCRRLGELLRQEQERLHQMKVEGHAIYLQYVQQGNEAKTSKQVRSSETVIPVACRRTDVGYCCNSLQLVD